MFGFTVGDRVTHSSTAGCFGSGVVIGFGPKNVLVRWDVHSVTRRTRKLDQGESHVYARSLKRI